MPMPKIARVAAWVAVIFALLTTLSTLTNTVLIILVSLVFLASGIEIFRRHSWGAYGMALFMLTQFLDLGILFLRSTNRAADLPWNLPLCIFNLALIALFAVAGRSLASKGAKTGWRLPWIIFCAVIAVSFALYQPFVIPTGTMENTLLVGDRILVRRWPRPVFAHGDLVVMSYPVDRRQTYVKRIAGVPGDRIRLSNKALILNGARVVESYAVHKTDYIDAYRDNFPGQSDLPLPPNGVEMLANNVIDGEVRVPVHKYFVMGDNRDMSWDSRYFGLVDATDLIGKPALIYDSRKQSTEEIGQLQHAGWDKIRWNRFLRKL